MTDKPARVSLYQQVEQEALSLDSTFNFHCHAGLKCFNQCCRTPTIVLSPYDLLRLKQAMGLTSGEILARYTITGIEAASNLPLVFIDPYRSSDGGCPFLGPQGCSVYAHRPAACRLFPITMGSQLTEQGVVDYYFCRRLDYCGGFDTEVHWTLASWQANQGFLAYDQGRREWLEILLKTGLKGPVEATVHDLVTTMAYDLDEFRRMIFETNFIGVQAMDGRAQEELRKDDLTLLKFSYRHLKSILYGPDAGLYCNFFKS